MSTRKPIPILPQKGGDDDDAIDAQIDRLSCLAREVFRREDKAARWLRRPLRELGGISPLEMMETPAGARQVEALLRQYADE